MDKSIFWDYMLVMYANTASKSLFSKIVWFALDKSEPPCKGEVHREMVH